MPASNGVESVYVDGQLIQRQVSEVRIDGQGRRVVIFSSLISQSENTRTNYGDKRLRLGHPNRSYGRMGCKRKS